LSIASAAVVPGAPLETHALQDLGDGVANGGRRSQRKIDDTHLSAEHLRCLASDEFTDARDLERRSLDEIGQLGKRDLRVGGNDVTHNAGAGDSDVDAHLWLAAAVQGTSHERIILGDVAEDDQLGAADAVVVCRELAQLEDDIGHAHHGIHVDACPRAGHIDRRADTLRATNRRRYRLDQGSVTTRETLLHHAAKAADEVDTDLVGGSIEGVSHLNVVGRLLAGHNPTERCDRDAPVDDRNAVLLFNLMCYCNQPARVSDHLVVHPLTDLANVT
jgi:hypothetical protein